MKAPSIRSCGQVEAGKQAMKKPVFSLTMALVLAVLACSPSIRIPAVETGPIETLHVLEPPPPPGETVDVDIRMGPGSLEISGGCPTLLEGTIEFNVPKWRPDIRRQGNNLTLRQEISNPSLTLGKDVINRWSLRLGQSPIRLRLQAGAYSARMDFTGVPLISLWIEDGASDATVEFRSPNPASMSRLTYKTGASSVSLIGLGNARFHEMQFDGGAGSYLLDFTGTLDHSAVVRIRAGVSSLRLEIPQGTPSEILVGGGLTDVTTIGSWTQSGETYRSQGEEPGLTIYLDMGLGSLTLVKK